MSYETIHGQPWFYYLKPAKDATKRSTGNLFSRYSTEQLNHGLIVCFINYHGQRLFGYFRSYIEFAKYQLNIPNPHRTFFEIILGHIPQKPHFDLDFKLSELSPDIDPEMVKDRLVEVIIKTLAGDGVKLDLTRDLLLFTSHGSKKKSYHVIIDNYAHKDNLEAKAFYQTIVKLLPENEQKYIDHSVYGPTQNFRMVGSQKLNSNRPKKLETCWNYQGQEIKYCYPEIPDDERHLMVIELEVSLVSYTLECMPLPSFVPETKLPGGMSVMDSDFDEEVGQQAFQLLAEAGGVPTNSPKFPYGYRHMQGNLVILKRLMPSYCRICQRVHENENPYLIINPITLKIYFHCRRSNSEDRWCIGAIDAELVNSADKVLDILGQFIPEDTEKFNPAQVIEESSNHRSRPNPVSNRPVSTGIIMPKQTPMTRIAAISRLQRIPMSGNAR